MSILWVLTEIWVPEGTERHINKRGMDSKMTRGKSLVSIDVLDPEPLVVNAEKLLGMDKKSSIQKAVIEKGEQRGKSLRRAKRLYKRPTIKPVDDSMNTDLSITDNKEDSASDKKAFHVITTSLAGSHVNLDLPIREKKQVSISEQKIVQGIATFPDGSPININRSMRVTKGMSTIKEDPEEEIPICTNPGKEKPMDSEVPIDSSNLNLYPQLDRNTRRAPRHKYVTTLSNIPEEGSSSLVEYYENPTPQGISPNTTASGSPTRKLSNETNAVSGDSSPVLASSPRRSLARVKTRTQYLQKHEEVKARVSKATARLRKIWAQRKRR
ncbi:hypothetical protein MMC22_009795 [Lobaria immixta]|nr:hypothetical protein [Lobaria immixta]